MEPTYLKVSDGKSVVFLVSLENQHTGCHRLMGLLRLMHCAEKTPHILLPGKKKKKNDILALNDVMRLCHHFTARYSV